MIMAALLMTFQILSYLICHLRACWQRTLGMARITTVSVSTCPVAVPNRMNFGASGLEVFPRFQESTLTVTIEVSTTRHVAHLIFQEPCMHGLVKLLPAQVLNLGIPPKFMAIFIFHFGENVLIIDDPNALHFRAELVAYFHITS
jgi:hypothetical protein